MACTSYRSFEIHRDPATGLVHVVNTHGVTVVAPCKLSTPTVMGIIDDLVEGKR